MFASLLNTGRYGTQGNVVSFNHIASDRDSTIFKEVDVNPKQIGGLPALPGPYEFNVGKRHEFCQKKASDKLMQL
jgi:hypothetical protein